MLIKHGDGIITHVIKTAEDLEAEKDLAKQAKEETDNQSKMIKGDKRCS